MNPISAYVAMRGRTVRIGLLVAALVIIPWLPAVSAQQQEIHWCSPLKISMQPKVYYPKEKTTVIISVTNGISDSLDIQSFSLSFSWGTNLELGSANLAGYASTTFSKYFVMPDVVAGVKSASGSIHGQAVGDWWAETCSFNWSNSPPEVQERPPLTVSIQAPASTAKVGESLQFSAQVAGGTPPYQVTWTFGDGGTGTGSSVSHQYSSSGSYTVKVTVLDDLNRQSTDQVTVTITDALGLGGTSGGSSLVLAALAILGLIVAVAVVVAVLMRRKKVVVPPQAPAVGQMPPPEAYQIQQPLAQPQYWPPSPSYSAPVASSPVETPARPQVDVHDDGTTLIDRLKAKQQYSQAEPQKFDAYKPAVITASSPPPQPKRKGPDY